ncbi:GlmU family protein [Rhabdobacter roseus]|uniref:UDP-N-acetylglucosamine diphosphorylase/glucosamine-1-phosphate N-acetyltransferase n=1 Tax=Rhabdobacter roseus TaxID=1655419 RepID=A0A840TLU0_9BACT|nr:putative sugar nucleotidyl transferase [Rhabdobacter roseus]MBB5285196.1 UDP-N-acetylglucosamine diphosphorylase/glucosamine-1-phosphate N-acetyltransferase [Rhabdobacter roseus]
MANVILFDDPVLRPQLLPLTFTRPVAEIRCGIFTLAEKWARYLASTPSYLTQTYLATKYPKVLAEDNLYLNGALCPDEALAEAVRQLPYDMALVSEQNEILALRTYSADWHPGLGVAKTQKYPLPFTMIRQLWDIYGENGAQIRADYERIVSQGTSQGITDPFTHCYQPEAIFVEEGVSVKAAILNAESGPIYLGRNAVVSEGATIQGPFALGEGAVVAQGAKIRPQTTIGPYCKVGGEVNNSVLFGYSNKGHDGYLGNAVLGEWCNLGANTNNSNLKNDYTTVKLHSYAKGTLQDTGKLFCGLFMGDYSKAGISTMFNTGTVVGVNVNVFGAGFQPKHIPSFRWGGQAEGFTDYRFEKAMTVAYETVSRRKVPFGDREVAMLREVHRLEQAGTLSPSH